VLATSEWKGIKRLVAPSAKLNQSGRAGQSAEKLASFDGHLLGLLSTGVWHRTSGAVPGLNCPPSRHVTSRLVVHLGRFAMTTLK
jgi:hypothetical protein